MGSWKCLMLLCTFPLALAMKSDDDLVSFLRELDPGLMMRDEPFIINPDGEINSREALERADVSATPGPLVKTQSGQIKGISADKAHIFYGIPFADPPVGAYRWKPPRPVSPWNGVYDATFPRAQCMQGCRGPVAADCPQNVSEDCLYLNIFVPLDVNFDSPPQSPLPVMAWIHGGDFIAGSASKPLYDGRFLSNFSRTIVVSLEYRLGAFGFLVSGKDPGTAVVGNYGILDQQAALLWVQRNIAVFGGDSSKVTLFGESAGAQSVSVHLMVHSSAPLYQQAVLQSLPFSIPLKSRHDALKLGKDFAKRTNCSVSDVVCLRSLTPQAVLEAQMKTSSRFVNPFRFLEVFETWGPFVDGDLIKEQVLTAFLNGRWQKEKPVLLGTTSEEGVLFVYGVFGKAVSAVESIMYVTAIFKQHALRILHQYLPRYTHADRRDMLAQIVTDFVFLCPSRRSARAASEAGSHVWMYVFDHVVSDPRVWSGLTFCYRHACHGAELPFVFDSAPVANLTMTPAEKLLANRMLCYWGAFAHTGDPTSRARQTAFCREQRLPVWPRYSDTSSWLVMNLTLRSHAQVETRSHVCDFWDHLGVY
ncbi:cAMP-regulated D2 protein [Entelurus aequoreus]|uniref:cAMP-regulated D2 protein n=1 Tax=Entelurus aequoreus TaxID=161455 RepID=UPI002B1D1C9C|nr:cAMP-regulated D2 protein [Entelurus aequoreus]